MSETMQAARYERTGPAAEVLSIVSAPVPIPRAGEVLVRIHASGVNPADVKKRAGWRGATTLPAPVCPHSDGAGVIVDVGSGIDSSWVGRRVWIFNAQGGAAYGAANAPDCGTAAEYAAIPLPYIAPLPDNVDFATGACLGVPACTAHYAVFADGDVDGKTVLVQGGAGAVGELAVQFAAAAGARVIATVGSGRKAEIAHAAGAAHTIDRHGVDVARAIRDLAPDGVDRIIEVDFGANAALDAAVLKRGGIIASYSSPSEPNPSIPYYPLQFTIGLIRFVSVFLISRQHRERGLADVNYALSRGVLRPTIAASYPLGEIAAAHEAVESKTMIGNVVVTLG